MHILQFKLLGAPLLIWGLQLLYVAMALILFVVLRKALDKNSSHFLVQSLYVIVMLIINIVWRLAIRNIMPAWF
jgi:hypothetical protein